jgi:hypothetical protein
MTRHGFKNATTDPELIAWWWTRTPDANIAIATGAPGPDVLDIDVKPAGTGWAAYHRLRRAGLLNGAHMMCTTRNGGAHVYFAGTDQRCGSLGKQFIDFRSVGGYVMAPGSTVPADDWAAQGTGRYEIVWCLGGFRKNGLIRKCGDRRGSDARLDWAACKRLLTPPPRRATSPTPGRLSDLNRLPRWLCDRLEDADPPDRSAAFHRIVAGCAYAGLDLTQTMTLLESWPPAVDKYGPRVCAEVERSWIKVGGVA